MRAQSPPQLPLRFPQDAETVAALVSAETETTKRIRDQIITSSLSEEPTFANTIQPLADIGNALLCLRRRLEILQDVCPDSDLTRAISVGLGDLDRIQDSISDDNDLAKLVARVSAEEGLDGEQLRYLARTKARFQRRLLIKNKPGAAERLQEIEARIRELDRQFRCNCEDKGEITLRLQDLKGVPEQSIQSWVSLGIVEDEHVTFSFARQDHFDVLRFADNEGARKAVYLGGNRTADLANVALVQEVVTLRQEAASLQNVRSHADFRVQDEMAKTVANVDDFLTKFIEAVKPQGLKELNELKEVKRQHYETQGKIYDGLFYPWDRPYYYRRARKDQPAPLTFEDSREYFPFYYTTRRMLDMFERLFHLRFQIMPRGFSTWHEDVILFSVWDADDIGGEFLGYLYMDLIIREPKFSCGVNWTVQPGFSLPDGTRHYPSTAILGSYKKPTAAFPCLLNHQEVTSLFHELGHSIHTLVSRTRYACWQGTAAALDFSEGPSQMLEKFCWSRPFLEAVSCHYSAITDSVDLLFPPAESTPYEDKKLPRDIFEQMVASRTYMDSALFLLDQLQIAVFGLELFSVEDPEAAKNIDVVKVWNRLTKDVQLFDVPENPAEQIIDIPILAKMFSDYDVGYYSYHYSVVWFTDIFQTFFKDDVLNAAKSLEYRRRVLERSGKEDEMQVLKDFLGREPDFDAYVEMLFSKRV